MISDFPIEYLAVEALVGMSLLIVHEGKPCREVDVSDDGCLILAEYPKFKRHNVDSMQSFNLSGKNAL